MRILMLIDSYLPVLGGAQRHVRDLSTALVRRGHEVAVATLWSPGLPVFEVDQGVRVYRLHGTVHRAPAAAFTDPARRYVPPFPDPEAMMALRRIVARERPQIVHAHNWLVYSFLPLKTSSRARLVMTLHEYSLACVKWTLQYRGSDCTGPALGKCLGCAATQYGPAKGAATVLAKWAMRAGERTAIDLFLPVSRDVASRNGLVRDRLPFEVVPNFVLDELAATDSDVSVATERLPLEDYLLYVGALAPYKGLNVLLDAHAGLAAPPPLVCIGMRRPDTPRGFPPNVRVFEDWPHAAVMAAWQRCLLGLVPSVWREPFPTVALEAMACGRPVVASRTGGLTDIVADGETGILVPPGDACALRDAIQRLLDDAVLRRRMGEAAARRVARFRASAVVPRIEAAYQRVLGAPPGQSRLAVPAGEPAA